MSQIQLINKDRFYFAARKARRETINLLNKKLLERTFALMPIVIWFLIVMSIFCICTLIFNPQAREKFSWETIVGVLAITGIMFLFQYLYFILMFNKFYYLQVIRLFCFRKSFRKINNLVSKNEPFALYLRDYKAGREDFSYTLEGTGGDGERFALNMRNGSKKLRKISWKFFWKIPLI